MKTSRPRFWQSIRTGFTAFRAALPQIAVFVIVYKILTALIARPLLSLLMQILLSVSGDELAFNDQIWHFMLTVPGIIAVVVLAALSILLVYFEFAVIIGLAQQAATGGKASIRKAIVHALWAYKSLKSPSTILFALYALLMLPIVNMGITSFLLPHLTVPNFITGELTKTTLGMVALPVAAVAVAVVFISLLFVLPSMVLEHTRFSTAAGRSRAVIRA